MTLKWHKKKLHNNFTKKLTNPFKTEFEPFLDHYQQGNLAPDELDQLRVLKYNKDLANLMSNLSSQGLGLNPSDHALTGLSQAIRTYELGLQRAEQLTKSSQQKGDQITALLQKMQQLEEEIQTATKEKAQKQAILDGLRITILTASESCSGASDAMADLARREQSLKAQETALKERIGQLEQDIASRKETHEALKKARLDSTPPAELCLDKIITLCTFINDIKSDDPKKNAQLATNFCALARQYFAAAVKDQYTALPKITTMFFTALNAAYPFIIAGTDDSDQAAMIGHFRAISSHFPPEQQLELICNHCKQLTKAVISRHVTVDSSSPTLFKQPKQKQNPVQTLQADIDIADSLDDLGQRLGEFCAQHAKKHKSLAAVLQLVRDQLSNGSGASATPGAASTARTSRT